MRVTNGYRTTHDTNGRYLIKTLSLDIVTGNVKQLKQEMVSTQNTNRACPEF
jgi:hypothetical protein